MIIPIQSGNDVTLRIQPRLVDGTPVNADLLTDIEIRIGQGTFATAEAVDFTVANGQICIELPYDQPVGTYNLYMRALLGTRHIEDNRRAAFSRVPFSNGIAYKNYTTDLVVVSGMAGSGSSAEVEEMKQELEEMKQELEQLRQEYVSFTESARQKADELDDEVTALQQEQRYIPHMVKLFRVDRSLIITAPRGYLPDDCHVLFGRFKKTKTIDHINGSPTGFNKKGWAIPCYYSTGANKFFPFFNFLLNKIDIPVTNDKWLFIDKRGKEVWKIPHTAGYDFFEVIIDGGNNDNTFEDIIESNGGVLFNTPDANHLSPGWHPLNLIKNKLGLRLYKWMELDTLTKRRDFLSDWLPFRIVLKDGGDKGNVHDFFFSIL